MRGGAIPLFAWALLLSVLFALNAIWNGKAVSTASAGFSALVILAAAGLVVLRSGRRALRPGPPEPSPEPETVPLASSGAALAGLALAMLAFGFAFGHFLVDFGAVLLVVALGRLARERGSERESRERAARAPRAPAADESARPPGPEVRR